MILCFQIIFCSWIPRATDPESFQIKKHDGEDTAFWLLGREHLNYLAPLLRMWQISTIMHFYLGFSRRYLCASRHDCEICLKKFPVLMQELLHWPIASLFCFYMCNYCGLTGKWSRVWYFICAHVYQYIYSL